jgi:hypothetical protein
MNTSLTDHLGGLLSEVFREVRRLIASNQPEKAGSLAEAFAWVAPLSTSQAYDWVRCLTPISEHYRKYPITTGDENFITKFEALRQQFR